MSDENKKVLYHVYCDESSLTGHKYMVLGGIMIDCAMRDGFNKNITDWRTRHGMHTELKWEYVKARNAERYRSLLDLCLWLIRDPQVFQFRSVVFDMSKCNAEKHFGGDRELGFYTLFYHFLLYTFCRDASTHPSKVQVFLDERNTPYKLADLHKILNNGARKHFGCLDKLVVSLEPLKSQKSNVMQLADFMAGAIAYHWNGHNEKADASVAKCETAMHFAKKLDIPSLKRGVRRRNFEIWEFQFGA